MKKIHLGCGRVNIPGFINVDRSNYKHVHYKRDVGDPYYKYSQYYADNETDLLRLNKKKMIKYNSAYSTIKYLDFTIYSIQDILPTSNYKDVKKIIQSKKHKYTLCDLNGAIKVLDLIERIIKKATIK